ncbi:MAG: hypothetical protein WA945_05935 [Arcobacteraceae bacterium]
MEKNSKPTKPTPIGKPGHIQESSYSTGKPMGKKPTKPTPKKDK